MKTNLNPGPSITERARQLAREKQITFRAALRELGQRSGRKRRKKRQTDRIEEANRQRSVSCMERQGLF